MNQLLKITVTALVATLVGCGENIQGSSVTAQGLLSFPIGFSLLQNPPAAKGTEVAMEELTLAGAHDRYANLEVSYFSAKGSLASGWMALEAGVPIKAKGKFSGKGQWVQTPEGKVFYAEGWVVFEPNNEPLWAQIVSR